MPEIAELRKRYRDFAEFEAKDYSPSYWSFATAVAENDRVLERLAAGLEVRSSDIAAMGVGGLLKEMQGRPQPRQPRS